MFNQKQVLRNTGAHVMKKLLEKIDWRLAAGFILSLVVVVFFATVAPISKLWGIGLAFVVIGAVGGLFKMLSSAIGGDGETLLMDSFVVGSIIFGFIAFVIGVGYQLW